jgi:hypothetical protein
LRLCAKYLNKLPRQDAKGAKRNRKQLFHEYEWTLSRSSLAIFAPLREIS